MSSFAASDATRCCPSSTRLRSETPWSAAQSQASSSSQRQAKGYCKHSERSTSLEPRHSNQHGTHGPPSLSTHTWGSNQRPISLASWSQNSMNSKRNRMSKSSWLTASKRLALRVPPVANDPLHDSGRKLSIPWQQLRVQTASNKNRSHISTYQSLTYKVQEL